MAKTVSQAYDDWADALGDYANAELPRNKTRTQLTKKTVNLVETVVPPGNRQARGDLFDRLNGVKTEVDDLMASDPEGGWDITFDYQYGDAGLNHPLKGELITVKRQWDRYGELMGDRNTGETSRNSTGTGDS